MTKAMGPSEIHRLPGSRTVVPAEPPLIGPISSCKSNYYTITTTLAPRPTRVLLYLCCTSTCNCKSRHHVGKSWVLFRYVSSNKGL